MGSVIIFVVSLAVWAALLTGTVTLAAHCYLVVVQGTAAGLDEVKWPDEPFHDWLQQAAALTALAVIWLAPVGILSRALGSAWLPGQGFLRFLLLAGPVFWFLFPLSLLSSMGSTSRWQILNGKVLLGLLKLTPSLLIFYPVTAGLFAAVGALGYIGLLSPAWYALPVASGLGAAVLLIHGRLVGRLAWLLQQLRAPRPKPTKGKSETKRKPRKSRAAVNDPWAAREREEGQEPRPAAGYRAVEVPEPKAPRPHYMDPEPEPFTLAESAAVEETAPAAPRIELNQAQVEREIGLRTRTPPKPPPYPMFSGVWTFPFYQTSAKAWLGLAVWTAATGGLWRVMLAFFPG